MTSGERQALDFSAFTVRFPDASYFDVDARMKLLANTKNALLLQEADNVELGPSCRQQLVIPPIRDKVRIPGFHSDPDAWRAASVPLFQFEDAVSEIAGAYVASMDPYYADCLGELLDKWARSNALIDFHYSPQNPQAWFSTGSVIVSVAMAYSIVRPVISEEHARRDTIDEWLNRLAHRHAFVKQQSSSSCCNNYFYVRALYASIIGVMTNDNTLFQYGVSAVYSALHEMEDTGGLPRELARGRRATHHQNFALLYLMPLMAVITRQGYDVFTMELDGRSISTAVNFTLDALEDSAVLGDSALLDQYRLFLEEDRFFAWMEIYQQYLDDPRVERFLRTRRPIYNGAAGGFLTLYFMAADAQDQSFTSESLEQLPHIVSPMSNPLSP